MKKLSVLLVGLLSLLLIISVSIFAEDSGSVSSTLSLDSVIDLTILDSTDDVIIDNSNQLSSWNDGSVNNLDAGDFTVKIISLTEYTVEITSSSSITNEGANGTISPSINGNPLKVDSTNYSNSYYNNATGISGKIGGGVTSLDPDFSQGNNIDGPGESMKYDLSVDPSTLSGDWDTADSVQFTINVTVSDNTV